MALPHISPPSAPPDGSSLAGNPDNSDQQAHLGFRTPTASDCHNASDLHDAAGGASSSSLPHDPSRPDGSLPAGEDNVSFGSLGFHNNPAPFPKPINGGFPKVSTNYDRLDKDSRSLINRNDNPLPEKAFTKQQDSHAIANPNPQQQDSHNNEKAHNPIPRQRQDLRRKSFAEAAARRAAKPPDLFTHSYNAIKPVKMNEGLTVLMPEKLYEECLISFQFALIGRLHLPQGSTPRNCDDIKSELSTLFKSTGEWVLMPLGKGFFSLKFQRQDDHLKAAHQASWKLSTGSMQIREWKPNFDPYKEISSTSQIWVRLFHLPAEYWHPKFLVGIFRTVGNVIKLDGNTAHGLVGHFARALVEIDLRSPLLNTVRVGLPDNLFYVDFSYENIPLLCSFCHFVGHSVDKCRKAKAAEKGKDQQVDEDIPKAPKGRRQQTKKWMEKIDQEDVGKISADQEPVQPTSHEREKEVKTSNSFQALQQEEDIEEHVPETPAADLLDMVTRSNVQDKEVKQIQQRLCDDARELARLKQLRQERDERPKSPLTSEKIQELADRLERARAGFQVPSSSVGLPRSSMLAPNSPHPARATSYSLRA